MEKLELMLLVNDIQATTNRPESDYDELIKMSVAELNDFCWQLLNDTLS